MLQHKMPNSKRNVNWVSLPLTFLFSFSVSFLSVAFSVWWVRVSLLWQVCFVVTSVIDRTVCLRATEWCSWKYIICNFSCVNIAGSLVKQREKWFWERKCCLFWKQKKSFLSFLFFSTMRAEMMKLEECSDVSVQPHYKSQANQSQGAWAIFWLKLGGLDSVWYLEPQL